MRTITLGLAGCGVVGGGLVHLLSSSAESLRSRHGVRVELVGILVRNVARDRGLSVDPSLFTDDVTEFLAADADIVVEAIGGEEPARRIAQATLASGRRFISANKEFISAFGTDLQTLASTNDGVLQFDAAVGGSVPIIRTIQSALGGNSPASIKGILNGTSNFILTQLERGKSYECALAAARERGLAEDDVSRDVDGRDAAAKLAILAWVAFGIPVGSVKPRTTGILPDPSRLVRAGAAVGGRVRLVAECVALPGNRLTAVVEPVVVSPRGSFGQTVLEDNRVEVDLGWGSPLSVSGPGAGGAPTATSLLSDILANASPLARPIARNERAWVSVGDPRKHRWIIGADASPELIVSCCSEAGVPVTDVLHQAGDAYVTTGPSPTDRIDSVIASLRNIDLKPLRARFEINESEVVS
ncbi:MAG TPA: homoserine dehydrogenase [Gemmatimonadaceae bacterium]|nr:homoserine dehydrogenase [Gemmatimonadaceae bacterium]